MTDGAGNTASVTHVVSAHWGATDLAVSLAGSTPRTGQYTYTVTVKNLGRTAAHGVVVTNTLDHTQLLAGAVSAPAGVACGGVPIGATGTITCKAAASTVLAGGTSWVFRITVRQPSSAQVRTVSDTAQVHAANPDPVVANNSARLATARA